MSAQQSDEDATRLLLERNLYRGLLELNEQTELPSFLNEALGLMLQIAGATHGYLEIFDEADGDGWFTSVGWSADELNDIRKSVSRGIIAEAVASGRAVVTPSALLDPRFSNRGSVRRSKIEAVLCCPIGASPPAGVVYLQGQNSARPFTDADLNRAEVFGRHLAPLVQRVFETQARAEEDATANLRRKLRADELVGRSSAIARLLEDVALAAPLDVSVLITGETGTGKSQLARLLHLNSPRCSQPFVEVNCATIPESLLESELFGAMPGAHSTASKRIEGKVAAAEGGTLVLDEITELSVAAQAKLLQLLQTKEYYPLGASRALTADVRLIAATNADLATTVEERRFREDLYYRLQVLPIRTPALAERREDLELLARHFCEKACSTHSLRSVRLSLGSLRTIRATVWRGNVRELSHVVEAAAIRAAGQHCDQVEPHHLFGTAPAPAQSSDEPLTFQEETRRFQAELLRSTLQATGWNIAATARRLDLARSHIYNLIKAFGLARQ